MLPHLSATQVVGSNLETTKKRLSIVFSKFLSPKQGALRVECIETKKATMRRERCGRLQTKEYCSCSTLLFGTMCSACAERDAHCVRDVAFGSDVRFARE